MSHFVKIPEDLWQAIAAKASVERRSVAGQVRHELRHLCAKVEPTPLPAPSVEPMRRAESEGRYLYNTPVQDSLESTREWLEADAIRRKPVTKS